MGEVVCTGPPGPTTPSGAGTQRMDGGPPSQPDPKRHKGDADDEPSDAGSPWKEGHIPDRAPNVRYEGQTADPGPLEDGIKVDEKNAAELAADGFPAAAEPTAQKSAALPVTATPNNMTAQKLQCDVAFLGREKEEECRYRPGVLHLPLVRSCRSTP